jgi:hypothetical protein
MVEALPALASDFCWVFIPYISFRIVWLFWIVIDDAKNANLTGTFYLSSICRNYSANRVFIYLLFGGKTGIAAAFSDVYEAPFLLRSGSCLAAMPSQSSRKIYALSAIVSVVNYTTVL